MSDRSGTEVLVRVLAIVAALMVAVIVAVTVWAFATGHAGKGARQRAGQGGDSSSRTLFADKKADPSPEAIAAQDPAGKTAVFSDIGLLRARTANKEPVTVVVSPYFPYPSDDVAFREEIVGKTRAIRKTLLDWFAAQKIDQIDALGEAGVKKALIERINSCFTLGKIDTVYFGEYLVIE
jgi:flagellar basal body-associated protein FliL